MGARHAAWRRPASLSRACIAEGVGILSRVRPYLPVVDLVGFKSWELGMQLGAGRRRCQEPA
eukprot:354036-Chlamydomonas_euryale.AAC.1